MCDTPQMARTVYALLVGIDQYEPPVAPALRGCVNDMKHLETYLRGRIGDDAQIVTLFDAAATHAGVSAAFRTHLGRATAGDVAIFAYAGHGSQEPVPPEFAGGDASGQLQNLLTFDSWRSKDGTVTWPMADKELSLLLSEVSASGAHTVAILDCCHCGDGTRDATTLDRQWVPDDGGEDDPTARAVVELSKQARPLTGFLDGTSARFAADKSDDHVALFACQSSETAKELIIDDEHRGAFSSTLLRVLETLGPQATYRSVLAAVRSHIERDVSRQRPDLFPDTVNGLGDGRFLDGTIEPGPAAFLMTRAAGGWTIDAGVVHGLRAPVDGEEFRLSCTAPDGTVAGTVRVVSVDVGRSMVEPIGWTPDDTVYRAVISSVPLPMATVSFDPTDGPAAAALVVAARAALGTHGPAGGPSLFVREAAASSTPGGLALRVGAGPDGLQALRPDGSPVMPGIAATTDADELVTRLEHIARWEQLRSLGSHRSALADAVTLDVYPAEPSDTGLPADRPALVATGEYRLSYGPGGTEPFVYLQLRNTSDRDVWVALLDLTDQFQCDVMYPATALAAGQHVNLKIQLSVADPTPGSSGRDWLKVLMSESEFRADAFQLGRVGGTTRSAFEPANLLERIGARTVSRGAKVVTADDGGDPGADWCASTVGLVIEVPA